MAELNFKIPRSIVGYGYSSLVTLPTVWLRHHELEHGMKLSMKMDEDGNLVLMPIKKIKRRRKKA